MMVHICDNCVFCGRLPERNQRACGCYDDELAQVRASVLAGVHEECGQKLTLGDVQEMRRQYVALKERRERDSATLLKVENLIEEVAELVGEMWAEVTVKREDVE